LDMLTKSAVRVAGFPIGPRCRSGFGRPGESQVSKQMTQATAAFSAPSDAIETLTAQII
jgi:hypothetical protein